MTLVSSPNAGRVKTPAPAELSRAVGRLEASSNLPLYQQLQRALREAIDRRILDANDALPAERDLAEELGVSRITVRKAIDGLVNEGLLSRRQGSGTFVRGRVEKNFSMLTSFSEDMRVARAHPRSEWLKRTSGTVTPEEALTLRSSPGTPVYRFNRLRFADDAPMCARIRDDRRDLPAVARSSGELPVRGAREGGQPTGARAAAPARGAPDARTGGAAARQSRRRRSPGRALGFLQDGRAVEFSQSYYRGDTYDFVAELSTSR